jgi:2'-5' RNA ligase
VLWFGVEGDTDRLARLQKDLSDAHEPLGYKPERRPYSPHITVARKGDHPLPDPLPNPLHNLLRLNTQQLTKRREQPNPEANPAAKCSPAPASKPSPEPCWEVRRIVLYETRMGHSPMYKELAVLPLGSG